MTKRDGEITGKCDRAGNAHRRSPRSPSHCEYNSQETDWNHQRYSIGSNDGTGSFNTYRDSRSAPNSMPGSAAGSRANSRPGSRPGSRMHSRCNSAESIIDLFDSMTIKYGQNLEAYSPLDSKTTKPRQFANTRISYVDRVRINSAVWRSWHMQYVKKKKSIVCSFSSPYPDLSSRLQSDVIQGKTALTGYKPEELGLVVRNYNKWRLFSRDILTQRPMPPVAEDRAIDLNSPHPPLSPGTGTGRKLVNDDLFKDVADTLFISRKKKLFKAPAPKKVTHMINYNPDYLQPDLSTLLPEVDDDFMEAVTSVQAILCRTPTKNDPRQMGLMDDLPNTFFTSENFNALFPSEDMEQPQIVTAGAGGQQNFPQFNQNQSAAPTPQKTVSFSAPTTPRDSAASSPGFQGVSSPYDFVGSLRAYEHNQHGMQQQQQQCLQQPQSSFNAASFIQQENHPTSHVLQQHPMIMETLQNAPTLPTSPPNLIHTVGVSSPASMGHNLGSVGMSSPGESTSSTSGHVTPEAKTEPGSPYHQQTCARNLTYVPPPTTTVVGGLCYQVSDLATPINQAWHPATTTTIGPTNQLFSLVGDLGGAHSITVQGNQIIAHSPVYHQEPEMMDVSQPTTQPTQQRSQAVFKLPSNGDIHMSPGTKSPKGYKRGGPIHADKVHAALNRKKSTGGTDDVERHVMSVPSSCHASNASSAASSPGNEESGRDFETSYHNSKKRGNTDLADRDDRAIRRKRKHLDSEHKRRFNIQTGLEELQKIIPSLNNGNSSSKDNKISTSVLLQKAQEHIHSLQEEVRLLSAEKEKMKKEIDELNDDIERCQDALPDTGAPVYSQNDLQLTQMLDEYMAEEMKKEWKYWIFSKFAKPLFSSFLSSVKMSSTSSISGDLVTWVEESCRLRHLRSLALIPVRKVSKETSILTDPAKLPEQVEEIIAKETSSNV